MVNIIKKFKETNTEKEREKVFNELLKFYFDEMTQLSMRGIFIEDWEDEGCYYTFPDKYYGAKTTNDYGKIEVENVMKDTLIFETVLGVLANKDNNFAMVETFASIPPQKMGYAVYGKRRENEDWTFVDVERVMEMSTSEDFDKYSAAIRM